MFRYLAIFIMIFVIPFLVGYNLPKLRARATHTKEVAKNSGTERSANCNTGCNKRRVKSIKK